MQLAWTCRRRKMKQGQNLCHSLPLIDNWSLFGHPFGPRARLASACGFILSFTTSRVQQKTRRYSKHLGRFARSAVLVLGATMQYLQYFLFSRSIRLLCFISLPKAENPSRSRSTRSRDVYRQVWGQNRWAPKSRSSFATQFPTISDLGRSIGEIDCCSHQ